MRNVFLFGAGAAMPWEAPSTQELTKLIRQSGYNTADNKTTITEFIFQTLLANGFSDDEINFETIIGVIEELIVYYSSFHQDKKASSLLSCFFTPKFEKEYFNYSVKGREDENYYLNIPANVEYHFSSRADYNQTPPQFFFQHLIADLLTEINARIAEYAYHTENHSTIVLDNEVSKLFIAWMTNLSRTGTLRLYTLNYERIFKVLGCRAGLQLFEGFNCEECIPSDASLRANVSRILQDAECHCFYNLHGSAFWEVLDVDKNLLPNPEIRLTGAPNLPINNTPASLQMEKGKTLLVTNIVTGYQKAQKAMITPFKQMQSAFDKDCCIADHIYIVGFSFGDEHINESIKTAIRHNEKLRFTIIDPSFIKNDMDYQFALKFFPFYKEPLGFRRKKVKENLYSFFEDKFTVHTMKFEEFLTMSHL